MRGGWLGPLGWAMACAPPGAATLDATEATTSTTELLATSSSTGLGSTSTVAPPSTFGMDAPADEGTEVGFVPPLDLACSGAPGAAATCALCDVREQACLDDFRCVAWAEDGGDAWNGTKCIGNALEPVGVGQACTVTDGVASGRDDCPTGAMCWDADPVTLAGVCVPFCAPAGDEPVCPAGTQCMLDGAGVLALCLPTCHPLDPASCLVAATCRFMPESAAAFCIPDDGGRVLAPTIQCGDEGEACPAAEVCVSARTYGGCGSPSCCTAWCDLARPEADAQCAAGRPDHTCVPVFESTREPAPPGYEALGVCAVPAA